MSKPSSKDAIGGIQSLDTALRVLKVLSGSGKALSLTELARLCELQPTKVHRYLASFTHAGLVEQNGKSGAYNLGKGSIELGLSAIGRHNFVNEVSEALPDLSQRTGLTALLCIWGSFGPTVIRWERAEAYVITSLGLGTTMPLLTSATGRIALAFLPEQVTGTLLEKELGVLKQNQSIELDFTPTKSGVETLVSNIHEQGYATVDGRFIPGLSAIAAPVLDWQSHAQAIVTLIGTNSSLAEQSSGIPQQLLNFCQESGYGNTM